MVILEGGLDVIGDRVFEARTLPRASRGHTCGTCFISGLSLECMQES